MAVYESVSVQEDSAKAIKEAFRIFADNIRSVLGEGNVAPDYKKLRITVISEKGKQISIALRKGCSSLGYKGPDSKWKMIPDDYILYTPEYDPEIPFTSQFHVFTNEEYLQMWEKLGLIRYKVSTSTGKKLRESGMRGEISIEKYADSISIQSFSNSAKKRKALADYLKSVPSATEKYMLKIIKEAET